MRQLLKDISRCEVCKAKLELGPRPVVSCDPKSKIIIIGQAPGTLVHKSGIPWDDKSGENLRNWMNIDNDTFYNPELIGIMPMGFCYPGRGKSGDLPPTKECAPLWHDQLLKKMPEVELIMLIGKYAQDYYLQDQAQSTLTATVKNFLQYLPKYFVLPHPSPRNNIWQARNEWFKLEVIPELQRTVKALLP